MPDMKIDQRMQQKIGAELLSTPPEELDQKEVEFLQERAGYVQRMTNSDSRIQTMEKQIEELQKERSRLEGVADYLLNKAIDYRYEKMTKGDTKLGDTKRVEVSSEPEKKEAAQETAADGSNGSKDPTEVKLPVIPRPKKKRRLKAVSPQ